MSAHAQSSALPTATARRLLTLQAVLVYAFFYAPIAVLVFFSFNDSTLISKWEGFTVDWYRAVAESDPVKHSIGVSLQVALWSTVVATALGTLAALALERFRWRGQRVFDALLYLPVIIPDVTMAVMLLLFFVQLFDIIDAVFGTRLSNGVNTITLSHIAFNISFVAIVVRARITGLDPHLEEAASDLYAGRWQTFRRVTLPLIMPGVLGGALLALTLSLDDVVISSFVAGPGSTPLPVYVFGLLKRGVTPLINAVSTLMLAASILLVAGSLLVQRARGGRMSA